jgi:hypothetical protein
MMARPDADDGDPLARPGQAQPLPARQRPPPDGYHELQTLFIFLNHGDWLEFDPLPRPAHPEPGHSRRAR